MKQTCEVRPAFTLMKLNDAISHFHMQMPRWLFSDPQYTCLSLESKVAYMFLPNRFQLSRRNGWVNRHGEVYVIYTRIRMRLQDLPKLQFLICRIRRS